MNILDWFKIGKFALSEKGQVQKVVQEAKLMNGPKPSWQTGEFWTGVVAPMVLSTWMSAKGMVPAKYALIGDIVLGLVFGGYRTILKAIHVVKDIKAGDVETLKADLTDLPKAA